MTFVKYSFGRNSSFLLWHDPWLDNNPLLCNYDTSIFSITGTDSMTQLGSIMDNFSWQLPTSNHMLVRDLRSRIEPLQIRNCDCITWQDTTNPSVSSIYHSLRHRSPAPVWIKAIWHSFHIPKCSFFLWLALRNRLLTKDRMVRFGLAVDTNCVLCNNGKKILFICSPRAPFQG